MSTANQWLNFAEIKRMVAQRVANAIETIAIYETKTRMARDSLDRVERQEYKEAKNASNKRKWEGDHDKSSSQQQNKGHKVIRAHAAQPSNKKVYVGKLPHCNKYKLHHNGPCYAKIRNVETKLEVVKHVEGCVLWEDEKPIKTLTTLQITLMRRERPTSYLVKPWLELS
ncbi:hypothetical protein Tco_1225912 [Tanacetum coccineum]